MENEDILQTMKETLIFLVEQEKIRADEIKALNEKIDNVNDTLVNQIINPSIEAYNEEQFNDFDGKYGERLGKYDATIQSAQNNPDYSSSREAWNELQSLPEEERGNVDLDAYVSGVEQGLDEYVSGIKSTLGLSDDTPVEIKQDENGDIKVKADEDKDGKMETVAETAADEKVETPVEVEKESEYEDSEPTDEEIAAYLNGTDLK